MLISAEDDMPRFRQQANRLKGIPAATDTNGDIGPSLWIENTESNGDSVAFDRTIPDLMQQFLEE